MGALPPIASLWVGDGLSWIEQLCLQSWVDRGHNVTLYTLGPVSGVPAAVKTADAGAILAPPFDVIIARRHRTAVYSDLFRIALLMRQEVIWVDCDAYGLRDLGGLGPYVFAPGPRQLLVGVWGLPRACETLKLMQDFVTRPNPIQPWRGPKYHKKRQALLDQGHKWAIEALPWGCSGPQLFDHFAKQTRIAPQAQPQQVFYPLFGPSLSLLHRPGVAHDLIEAPQVRSVHIFGATKKHLARHNGGLPIAGSYLDHLCQRHSIHASEAPATDAVWSHSAALSELVKAARNDKPD